MTLPSEKFAFQGFVGDDLFLVAHHDVPEIRHFSLVTTAVMVAGVNSPEASVAPDHFSRCLFLMI